jgi:hypothetical protein
MKLQRLKVKDNVFNPDTGEVIFKSGDVVLGYNREGAIDVKKIIKGHILLHYYEEVCADVGDLLFEDNVQVAERVVRNSFVRA